MHCGKVFPKKDGHRPNHANSKPPKALSAAKDLRNVRRSRGQRLYVRQSCAKQVEIHKEGRLRQYQLIDWALKEGWPKERTVVVDEDQGKSSACPNARSGFARLVAAMGRGEVGIVIAPEVTRLARTSPDWHNLIYRGQPQPNAANSASS